jgi:hypothetical protein
MQDMVGTNGIAREPARRDRHHVRIFDTVLEKRHQNGKTTPRQRTTAMTRRQREEIERKLAQARRVALEPTDSQTLERLAQQIEELEYQLLASRLAA